MERKMLLQCLVSLIITLLSPLANAKSFSKVENIFQQNVNIKSGDVMQCEITKTNTVENKNSFNVYTESGQHSSTYHQFYPANGKCFSFKLRAIQNPHINPHIILSSNTVVNDLNKLEVILGICDTYSAIRETSSTGESWIKKVSKLDQKGAINDEEYRGFWIRWLDDELLEVGLESESIPFLSYRFPSKLTINYVGIMTWYVSGAWIIDLDPRCPGIENQEKKMRAESDCFILKE